MSDASTDYTIKDSGKRETYGSGMVRDTTAGKLRPDLIKDGPMYLRWILHLTKGAVKYAARNWMKARGKDEFDRGLESTDRHYFCWYMWRRYGLNVEQLPNGPVTREPLTEDHAAGIFFNVNLVEYTAEQMAAEPVALKVFDPDRIVGWPDEPGTDWVYRTGGQKDWQEFRYRCTADRDQAGNLIIVALGTKGGGGSRCYKFECDQPVGVDDTSWFNRNNTSADQLVKWRKVVAA